MLIASTGVRAAGAGSDGTCILSGGKQAFGAVRPQDVAKADKKRARLPVGARSFCSRSRGCLVQTRGLCGQLHCARVPHLEQQVRLPGVEPGAQAWEACMLPLHYRRPCVGGPDASRLAPGIVVADHRPSPHGRCRIYTSMYGVAVPALTQLLTLGGLLCRRAPARLTGSPTLSREAHKGARSTGSCLTACAIRCLHADNKAQRHFLPARPVMPQKIRLPGALAGAQARARQACVWLIVMQHATG